MYTPALSLLHLHKLSEKKPFLCFNIISHNVDLKQVYQIMHWVGTEKYSHNEEKMGHFGNVL